MRTALSRAAIVAALTSFAIVHPALANHGPGTSGGGASTVSGETLHAGGWDASIRFDYTEFENIGRAEADSRAAAAGEFDAVRRAFVTTVGITYGVTDDFQAGVAAGYYSADHFISAEDTGGGAIDTGEGDPHGFTDLWLNGKYRFYQGPLGNIAAFGGVKFPVGDDNIHLSNGEPLEPSSAPSSGAFDFLGGVGYSRFLTPRITVDASASYTYRMEHDGFKVGDRLDLGTALAYRITDSIKAFPQFSIFGEVLGVWLDKDRDGGEKKPNTGGWTVYLSPGLRCRLTDHIAATVAPAFPIWQDPNGDQIRSKFKLGVEFEISF